MSIPLTAAAALAPRLAALNDAQRRAVAHHAGPLLVCAGPGSGKTATLTLRIARLIANGSDPRTILAVTFTTKAARAMRDRVAGIVGPETAALLTIGTFHGLCARWLRHLAPQIGRSPDFSIYDDDDSAALLRGLLADEPLAARLQAAGLRPAELNVEYAARFIAAAKARLSGPAECRRQAEGAHDTRQAALAELYAAYQGRLREANGFDFDDLIFATAYIFERSPALLAAMGRRYHWVHLDEAQDTSTAQLRLLELLCAGQRNLFAVGDRSQSLYSWRDALPTVFEQLLASFPEAGLIKLEQNYRSTATICAVAQALIEAGGDPGPFTTAIWSEREAGLPVRVGAFRSEVEEAKQVADEIERLFAQGYAPGDVAIIYRTNAQARPFEELFVKRGVPHELIGDTPFYGRAEIKNLLAFLRVLHNRADTLSLLRVLNLPRRGIGAAARTALLEHAQAGGMSLAAALQQVGTAGPPLRPQARRGVDELLTLLQRLGTLAEEAPLDELLRSLLGRIGYRDYLGREYGAADAAQRWQRVQGLLAVAGRFGGVARASLPELLAEAALMGDDDLAAGDRVSCTTLYRAKGLEWPVVFVVGLGEGLLPHRRAIEGGALPLAEERRGCYVALSRARDRLYLSSFAYRTTTGGPPVRCLPSRFLRDMPPDLCVPWAAAVTSPPG